MKEEPYGEHAAADNGGLVVLDERVIRASPDDVWKLLIHVQDYDKVFDNCTRIKNCNKEKSLNPIQPGSRYLEKRKVLGETLNNKCTVTSVVDTEMEKTFVLFTNTYGCSLTSTHTVQPLDDSDLDGLHPTAGCRLVMSYGVAPNGCWGRLLLRLARIHMIQLGKASLMDDLDSIQKVAEKRAKDAP